MYHDELQLLMIASACINWKFFSLPLFDFTTLFSLLFLKYCPSNKFNFSIRVSKILELRMRNSFD